MEGMALSGCALKCSHYRELMPCPKHPRIVFSSLEEPGENSQRIRWAKWSLQPLIGTAEDSSLAKSQHEVKAAMFAQGQLEWGSVGLRAGKGMGQMVLKSSTGLSFL